MDHTIWVEGLVKRYGPVTALDGIDFAARRGSVLAVLGPNGAGKTTAARILSTLTAPTPAGRWSPATTWLPTLTGCQLIALTGQFAAVDEKLTGVETLTMIGRLLGLPRPDARARASRLLARFGLDDASGRAVKTYSGRMRRRLDGRPGGPSSDPVPRRADVRPGSEKPQRPLERRAITGGRRGHHPAHHSVPRGS